MPGIRGGRVSASVLPVFVIVALSFTGTLVPAGQVRTQSGFVVNGRPIEVEGLSVKAARQGQGPVTIYHLWMVDDGLRRTFVPQRQVRKGDVETENLLNIDEFEIRRERRNRVIGPTIIGSYLEKTPFDLDGRRTVTLAGAREPIPIIQEITRLRPDIVTVNGVSHRWTHALTTTALSDETLLALLRKATDASNPQDRLRIVQFLSDADRYTLAQQELAAARKDFTDLAARADQVEQQLNHLISVKALGEIKQRRRAGQDAFAYAYAQKFPADRVSADVWREANQILESYRTQVQQMDNARILLGELQALLPDEQAEQIAPLRSILCDELGFATVNRLEPFLRSESDDTLSADEKLALAYTGWLLGDARADTDLALALRLWRARFLTLEYLRSNQELDRKAALRELLATDSASVSTLATMIPHLPPALETGAIEPGIPSTIQIPGSSESDPVRYSVLVPPEYSPGRAYPLLIVLRSQGATCEDALRWWAGTVDNPGSAMRHGYIVVAPEYAEATAERYQYGTEPHRIVLETLRDARRRFQVNSDRVFLA
ncbi:MAG: hypothetical protein KF861_22415, partial [Planctomycetaceae bacterium]|nr:hypothetical protein [Planctomycetaceae bacterium]